MPTVKTTHRWARVAMLAGAPIAMGLGCNAESAESADAVQCSNECPDGTSRSTYDKVVAGDAKVVVSDECETSCQPILPCTYPNIPLIADQGGIAKYSCEPLEGYTAIPKDDEVDFSWSSAAHCVDGQTSADETGVDCGGAECGPC